MNIVGNWVSAKMKGFEEGTSYNRTGTTNQNKKSLKTIGLPLHSFPSAPKTFDWILQAPKRGAILDFTMCWNLSESTACLNVWVVLSNQIEHRKYSGSNWKLNVLIKVECIEMISRSSQWCFRGKEKITSLGKNACAQKIF